MTLAQANKSLGFIKANDFNQKAFDKVAKNVSKSIARSIDEFAEVIGGFIGDDYQGSANATDVRVKKQFNSNYEAGVEASAVFEVEVDSSIVDAGLGDLYRSANQFIKSHKIRERDLEDLCLDAGDSLPKPIDDRDYEAIASFGGGYEDAIAHFPPSINIDYIKDGKLTDADESGYVTFTIEVGFTVAITLFNDMADDWD